MLYAPSYFASFILGRMPHLWPPCQKMVVSGSTEARYLAASLLLPRQLHVRVHGFISRHHIGPILDVMIRVNYGEHGVVHVPVLISAGKIAKLELHFLRIG